MAFDAINDLLARGCPQSLVIGTSYGSDWAIPGILIASKTGRIVRTWVMVGTGAHRVQTIDLIHPNVLLLAQVWSSIGLERFATNDVQRAVGIITRISCTEGRATRSANVSRGTT